MAQSGSISTDRIAAANGWVGFTLSLAILLEMAF